MQPNSFPWQSPLPSSNSLPATCTTGQSKVAAWLQDSEEMDRCAEGQFLPWGTLRVSTRAQSWWKSKQRSLQPHLPEWPGLSFFLVLYLLELSLFCDPGFLPASSPSSSQVGLSFSPALASTLFHFFHLFTSSFLTLPWPVPRDLKSSPRSPGLHAASSLGPFHAPFSAVILPTGQLCSLLAQMETMGFRAACPELPGSGVSLERPWGLLSCPLHPGLFNL